MSSHEGGLSLASLSRVVFICVRPPHAGVDALVQRREVVAEELHALHHCGHGVVGKGVWRRLWMARGERLHARDSCLARVLPHTPSSYSLFAFRKGLTIAKKSEKYQAARQRCAGGRYHAEECVSAKYLCN